MPQPSPHALLLAAKAALLDMAGEDALLLQAEAANSWFTPGMTRIALQALARMADPATVPAASLPGFEPARPLRVGIIMAGNVPLVGFQDLMATLLAGHTAVVKCSSRDPLLPVALVSRLPAWAQQRVQWVDALPHAGIDFLLATGSDTSTLHIAHDFAAVPQVLRRNRFSLAIARGQESHAQWQALAQDILLHHGMGCRSVSVLLVPPGFDAHPLALALDAFDRRLLSQDWWTVVKWEQAQTALAGVESVPCRQLCLRYKDELRPAPVGALHLVTWQDEMHLASLLSSVQDKVQVCLGMPDGPAFGDSQCPGLTDWADGVDVWRAFAAHPHT